ncbi:MAG: Fic family protein [Burkholderiales bacterium]|jgi:Fic family protein|nr:Fic family protein [Burkholderiales bacterium]
MKLEQYKAGSWRSRYRYKSFEPTPINHEWVWEDPRINTLLESAARALAELDAFSRIVPDIDLFIEMHVVKEAQKSSLIEGTQTGIDEVLMAEEQIAPEKRNDWREVRNYIEAANNSIAALANFPLSNRLLKNAHKKLMEGVRGEKKQPGEFRASQNWIGGSNLSDAVFIPPHQDDVPELMGDLEKFWHNNEIFAPHLIRIAISHYQFETIHPFLDGNGRIGRLLIPLYLVNHGLLAKPSLYLSAFFEKNRSNYYDALMRVRLSHDLIHWIRFFLQGVIETSNKGRDVFQKILALRINTENLLLGKKSPNVRLALNLFYKRPILTSLQIQKELSISAPTANAAIRDLIKLGLVNETTGRSRSRMYCFEHYLKLFLN